MIYPIVVYGHPVLRKVAEDISPGYKGLSELISDMFDTMYKSDGVGLAAPQIGKPIRMFVVDLSVLAEEYPEYENYKKAFINAHIVERSGDEITDEEGCLSLPGIREKVTRYNKIVIEYVDENFEPHSDTFEGWPARVLQHEYDHLDGILFVDKINPIRRKLLSGKLNSISKGKTTANYKIKTA